jgi:hypothetical protein
LFRSIALLVAAPLCGFTADFVGSQACARCHADIFRSFMRTPMAQSSGRAGTSAVKERFDSPEFLDSRGAFSYRAGEEGGKYYFDFVQRGSSQPVQGRRNLEYFVGSGAAAHSYLLSVDGFLYEAPVAFYSNSASWKAAPGYASYDYAYLNRPILPGCLGCHASGIHQIRGTQNGYESPPFREGGVACERCHGPGSEHITAGKPMINPAKLAAVQRDSICGQCHLSGEIRVAKAGKDDLAFVPGERLADSLTVFVRGGSAAPMRVTSHVENLAESACKRASGEKLWCGTCHDPHSVPAAAEKATYYRAKCLTCHKTSDCGAPQPSRQANGDDCATCHMPHNPPSDIDHVVFTDHSIRRRPAPARPSNPPQDAELVPFGGGEAGARDTGLAYAMLALREQNDTYRERAFRLLQEAAGRGAVDAVALAYLAEFYRDRKDDAHALPLYEQAWRMDPTQAAVAEALGAYQMQRGNLEEAVRWWNRALAINPALLLVRTNLAAALIRTGRAEEAQATLRKALEFRPSFQEARDLLNGIGQRRVP